LIDFDDLNKLKIEFSKCGNLLFNNPEGSLPKNSDKIFEEHVITHDEYSKNPEIVNDQNTVVRVNKRVYPWSIAGPIIISALVYRKNLDKSVIEKLEKNYGAKGKKKAGWGSWLWSRSSGNVKEGVTSTQKPNSDVKDNTTTTVTEDGNATKITKTKEIFIKKSLRPTNEQLLAMNLQPGQNTIRFRVASSLQGIREVRSMIYLWNKDDKIVISDIDGTITKSDVFGQILPIMGRDWSHSGVVNLYANIKANGYHMLYLTSRAIGQAGLTKGYINTLKHGDVLMPPGPVFLSPNRLLTAFNNEVILRRPEEFKIACLKDIKSIFPPNSQPFYAGFGNRNTDALSYRTVGIPLGKIFTINYKGELSIVNYTYKKTFGTLNDLANEMFPGLKKSDADEEWNQWNYWKEPINYVEEKEKPKKEVSFEFMSSDF